MPYIILNDWEAAHRIKEELYTDEPFDSEEIYEQENKEYKKNRKEMKCLCGSLAYWYITYFGFITNKNFCHKCLQNILKS